MKCCEECFTDLFIKALIEENDEEGTCDYCKATDVFIIDIADLTPFFDNLFKHYASTEPYEFFHPELHDDPSEHGETLVNLINEDWSIFSPTIEGTITNEKLLFDILNSDREREPETYIYPKNLYSRITDSFTFVDSSEEWEKSWQEFKAELKHNNRFFSKLQEVVFADVFDTALEYRSITLKRTGLKLYRARLGEQPKEKMLAPPSEITKAGRANPHGISYLYCGFDEETCISEVRPWRGATVTVGKLKLKKDLKVVDLSWKSISPFLIDSPYDTINITGLLRRFSYELSKPVDPDKTDIDYLPTQYITELIKSKGYDGICFQSSLGPNFNYVIFNEKNVEVENVNFFHIDKISYQYS